MAVYPWKGKKDINTHQKIHCPKKHNVVLLTKELTHHIILTHNNEFLLFGGSYEERRYAYMLVVKANSSR